MTYIPTIGLEIHVQLNTKTKMFCGCSNDSTASANVNVCPICLAYPGALPQLNGEAVRKGAIAGMMLGCEINTVSTFDRKNYFYPDASKNYQITQSAKPLCVGGGVTFTVDGGLGETAQSKTVRLHHIHLEEDVAKSLHYPKCSGVDFNRCGTSLMEIVTEPDLSGPDEVVAFLQALRQILVYADVSDCNLEEGNMRCDVNVSVRPEGVAKLGTRIEIKNMNTFSGIHDALRYEIARQISVLGDGGALRQETRRWDPDAQETAAMRSKENAHDYRYFPEPDVPPIVLDKAQLQAWRDELPELPAKKRERFVAEYGLPGYDAGVLAAQRPVADFFEKTAALSGNAKAASNWIMGELLRLLGERADDGASATGETMACVRVTPEALAELIRLIDAKTITGTTAKALFAEMFEKGGMPAAMVEERGLGQVSDTAAIETFARDVIAANPKVAEDFKGGKEAALQFLVGQVMKLSKGKANPQKAADALIRHLKQE